MAENDLRHIEPKFTANPCSEVVPKLVGVEVRHHGLGDGVVDRSAVAVSIVAISFGSLGRDLRLSRGLTGSHRRLAVLTPNGVSLRFGLGRTEAKRLGIPQ